MTHCALSAIRAGAVQKAASSHSNRHPGPPNGL